MSFYVLIPLAALLINAFVLGITYNQRRMRPVNRAFLFFGGLTALWIATEMVVNFLPLENEARVLIFRISALSWMLLGISFPNFALKLVGKRWKRHQLIALIVFVVVSFVIYTTTDLGILTTRECYWGHCPVNGSWHSWLSIVPSSGAGWGLLVIAISLFRTKDTNEKRIYALVSVGGTIALSLALFLDTILPDFLGITDVPRFGASAMAGFLIFIYAAVRRYNFLTVTTERFAEELFTDVKDGIVLIDKNAQVYRMNDAGLNILGYKIDDVRGKPAADILPDLTLKNDFNNRAIDWERKKEKLHLEISQSTITKEGVKLGRILVIRDVTERKQSEVILRRSRDDLESEVVRRTEELQQAQKMEAMGTLAGGIAHDFNNLLAAILGFTQAAKDDLPENSPLRTDLSEVLNAGHKARDIVRQILTFSRRHDFYPKEMNIVDAIEDSVSLLQASLPSTITINLAIECDSLWIFGDPSKISQVVMNLCTNAYQAIGDGGGELNVGLKTVHLDPTFALENPSAKPGEYVCLTVSDNGCGMDEEVLRDAFDPFFTTKQAGEGTGLGLSTVQSITQSHNAVIKAQSKPGEGTRFDVYFLKTERVANEETDNGIFPKSSGNEHILLVDDEEPIIRMTRRLVQPLGYRVTSFSHPTEAWMFYRENHEDFDLVITDQTMPKLTGIQLAEKIRSIDPDIPILLVSGFAQRTVSREAEAIGIKAFLHKPVSKRVLAETIRRILDKQTVGTADSAW